MHEIEVRHSFDAGHRVVGHEDGKGKCARLHGHTYSVVVTLRGPHLDETGFVLDFGAVKKAIDEWDHRLLLWDHDPVLIVFDSSVSMPEHDAMILGVVRLPFNPTAEHMAEHLAHRFRSFTGVERCRVELSETPKTTARYTA